MDVEEGGRKVPERGPGVEVEERGREWGNEWSDESRGVEGRVASEDVAVPGEVERSGYETGGEGDRDSIWWWWWWWRWDLREEKNVDDNKRMSSIFPASQAGLGTPEMCDALAMKSRRSVFTRKREG